MRSLNDSYGPYTTTGVYELPIGGCALNTYVLQITGTANADLQYWIGGTVWQALSGFDDRTATTAGTYEYALSRVRVQINSIAGGSVTLHHSGMR